jgi:DNA-directed RNA polymerase specialized sigma24 family protein
MSNSSELRGQIDEPNFFPAVSAPRPDVEAWELLYKYVGERVTWELRRRPLPRDMAAEDCINTAALRVFEKLSGFREEGAFSSYVDKLIKTTLSDRRYKNFRESIKRFLAAAYDLLTAEQHIRLELLIRECPEPMARALLTACIRGIPFDLLTDASLWPAARLELLTIETFDVVYDVVTLSRFPQTTLGTMWSQARSALIKLDGFEAFLVALPKTQKFSQAQTLLQWWHDCRAEESLDGSPDDSDDTSFLRDIPDQEPSLSERVEQRDAQSEMRSFQQKALDALWEHNKAWYYALILPLKYEATGVKKTDADFAHEIEQRLGIKEVKPNTVARWRTNARLFLKDYRGNHGFEA